MGGEFNFQAVILAGGLGTRLRPFTNNTPKPMVPINGRPFLEYEIELLKNNGIRDFVLCVGYLGEKIEDYFRSGKKLGVDIQYSHDGEELLGAAGALKKAEPLLSDYFFVTYGDAYLLLDYQAVLQYFLSSNKLGLMVTYENKNMYGKSDLIVKDGHVVKYDKRNQSEDMFWINFGVSVLRKQALELIPPGKACGEEEFYGELIKRGELLSYETHNRFYEIGNQKSLKEFGEFLAIQKE